MSVARDAEANSMPTKEGEHILSGRGALWVRRRWEICELCELDHGAALRCSRVNSRGLGGALGRLRWSGAKAWTRLAKQCRRLLCGQWNWFGNETYTDSVNAYGNCVSFAPPSRGLL